MYGDNNQQAYDRGISIFSPDGRLYQVEYAREAVKRGSPSVGVRTPDGVALAAEIRARSPLIERESVEKLHQIDTHIGVASAGHVADARQLIDVARQQAQMNQLRYDSPVGVEELTKHVTDHIQKYTQTGGARPFGVSLLFGGVENGDPKLYESDPSGTPYEWKATAIGANRQNIQAYLEENYSEHATLSEGVDLALAALAEPTDGLSANGVAVATIPTDTATFSLGTDDLEDRLDDLGILVDEEEN